MKNLNVQSLFNFYNKSILITGASGQIGSSIVKLFLDLGSKVYGFDKAKSIIKHANYKFIKIDITNKNMVRKKINDIMKKDNKIDVIINNAAVSIFSKYDQRTDLELDKTIDTNIKGLLNIINSYVYVHKKNNLKRCNIINIGSIYGILSPDFRIYGKKDRFSSEIYGATKAAVIQLTKYYSKAYQFFQVRQEN